MEYLFEKMSCMFNIPKPYVATYNILDGWSGALQYFIIYSYLFIYLVS